METSLALGYTNKPWGDMLYEEEQNRKMAFLRMPRAEWLACVNAYFNRLRGNGSALLSALAWFQQMEAERNAVAPAPAPEMDEDTRNWRVWQDMVEEPWKYGSDIGEWLEVDEEVRRGPKRWRVDAYWNAKVREMQEVEQNAAATKIQALWRGHNLRFVLGPRFNCACCLKRELCWTPWEDRMHWLCGECAREWAVSLRVLAEEEEREVHRISEDTAATKLQALWRGYVARRTLETAHLACERCNVRVLCEDEIYVPCYGHTWVCRACKVDEAEWEVAVAAVDAEEEDMCADCGDEMAMYGAKVGDCWFCPECIHDWTVCGDCHHAMRVGATCDNHCRQCGDSLENATNTLGYCSDDCMFAWQASHD
jgi:hypothetical protein